MASRFFSSTKIAAVPLVALFAGCSGGGSGGSELPRQLAAAASIQGSRPSSHLLYASAGNSVQIYDAGSFEYVGSIAKGVRSPIGVGVDGAGNLYVLNDPSAYHENVAVFPPGANAPARYLRGIDAPYPYGIAVDAAGGAFVAVEDSGAPDLVWVFAPGKNEPDYYISGLTSPYGIALDAHNDIFTTSDQRGGAIWEFEAGSKGPGKRLGYDITRAEGIAIDKTGRIVVSNPAKSTIEIFQTGQREPVASFGTTPFVNALAFSQDDSRLYVASQGGVLVYAYPSGKFITSLEIGNVQGVAEGIAASS